MPPAHRSFVKILCAPEILDSNEHGNQAHQNEYLKAGHGIRMAVRHLVCL